MANLTKIGPENRPVGETRVCVFHRAFTGGKAGLNLEQLGKSYSLESREFYLMTLREFLELGRDYLPDLNRIRSTTDKKERAFLKKKLLPAGCVSCIIKTRSSSASKEEKITAYNSLIVLDFDNLDDAEAAKRELSKWPCFWYLGLSASGQGLFGIVPVATDDWHEHRRYYSALEKEMKLLGYEVDENCRDEVRLRFISFDENPYFNDSCEIFSLPDEDEEFEESEDIEEAPNTVAITDNDRVKLYVEEWERKRIALDSYADWLAIGLSLSHEGEDGLAAFKRVSRFSSKYNEQEAEKKFRSFEAGNYSPGLGTFFYKCHQYGVIPDCVPHYDCIPFPVEVFPKKIQEIIEQTNRHQNFPIDYIAPCLLFVASLACGNSAVVELQRGWREKPLMYLAIVGGRGTNKTSCFDFALAPIRERDNDEYDNYVEAKALYDAELLKPAKERKLPAEAPVFRQFILSDFTPEVLVHQHRANPRGLIVFNDELIGFIYSFNKYRSGSDEQMWTQLFAGGGVTVNRVGADPVKINDTCIGVFGGIQPELLPAFARGKVQSGFMDRWLFAFPEKVKYPKFNDVDIDEKIAKNWHRIIKRILDLPFDETPKVVPLSAQAKALFKEWYDKLADQKNCGGSSFAGIATKMDRYCGRLALGLEVMKYGCKESKLEEISEDSLRGAIALCYYFLACGTKAHRNFYTSPVETLPSVQKSIYEALPLNFETGDGIRIADSYGMGERTFKRWLNSSLFKKIDHGYYEKKYR